MGKDDSDAACGGQFRVVYYDFRTFSVGDTQELSNVTVNI